MRQLYFLTPLVRGRSAPAERNTLTILKPLKQSVFIMHTSSMCMGAGPKMRQLYFLTPLVRGRSAPAERNTLTILRPAAWDHSPSAQEHVPLSSLPSRFSGRRPSSACTQQSRLYQAPALVSPPPHAGRSADAFARVRDSVRIPLYGCDCYAYGLLAAGHCDLVRCGARCPLGVGFRVRDTV
jgi:hypothetical protein